MRLLWWCDKDNESCCFVSAGTARWSESSSLPTHFHMFRWRLWKYDGFDDSGGPSAEKQSLRTQSQSVFVMLANDDHPLHGHFSHCAPRLRRCCCLFFSKRRTCGSCACAESASLLACSYVCQSARPSLPFCGTLGSSVSRCSVCCCLTALWVNFPPLLALTRLDCFRQGGARGKTTGRVKYRTSNINIEHQARDRIEHNSSRLPRGNTGLI